MYYEFLQRHKKRISISVLVLLGILFLWTAITLVGRIGKVPTVISVVPSNASVTLNGETTNNGTKWLTPGKYTIVAKRNGFEEQKHTVIIATDKKENVVSASLVPKSDEAKQWAEKNYKEYKDNERYGAKQASADGAYFADKNPITKNLPYTNPYYKIAYTTKDETSITITITTESPRYRFYALEKIREWKYDPTDFAVEFRDFKNPLEQP